MFNVVESDRVLIDDAKLSNPDEYVANLLQAIDVIITDLTKILDGYTTATTTIASDVNALNSAILLLQQTLQQYNLSVAYAVIPVSLLNFKLQNLNVYFTLNEYYTLESAFGELYRNANLTCTQYNIAIQNISIAEPSTTRYEDVTVLKSLYTECSLLTGYIRYIYQQYAQMQQVQATTKVINDNIKGINNANATYVRCMGRNTSMISLLPNPLTDVYNLESLNGVFKNIFLDISMNFPSLPLTYPELSEFIDRSIVTIDFVNYLANCSAHVRYNLYAKMETYHDYSLLVSSMDTEFEYLQYTWNTIASGADVDLLGAFNTYWTLSTLQDAVDFSNLTPFYICCRTFMNMFVEKRYIFTQLAIMVGYANSNPQIKVMNVSSLYSPAYYMRIIVSNLLPLDPARFPTRAVDGIVEFNKALVTYVPGKSTSKSPCTLVDNFANFDAVADTDDGEHPNTSTGIQQMAAKFLEPTKNAIKAVSTKAAKRTSFQERRRQ